MSDALLRTPGVDLPPNPRLKLTPEVAQEIVRRHRDGERTVDLARAFDMSTHTVRAAVRALAGGARHKPGKRVDPGRDAAMREAYESGESLITLATKFGLTAPTVRASVLRSGGSLRPKREAMRLAYERGRRTSDSILTQGQREALVVGYQAGRTVEEIVTDAGVSSSSLYQVLRDQGVPIRNSDYARFDSPERDGEIRRLYEAGSSTHELGERFHLSAIAINRAIRRTGGTIRTVSEAMRLEVAKGTSLGARRGPTKRKSPELEEAVCEGYQAGRTSWELAAEFKIGSETVLRIVRRHGIPVRRGGAPGGLTPEGREKAWTRFREGATVRALAREFGVSRSAIQTAVRVLPSSANPEGSTGPPGGDL